MPNDVSPRLRRTVGLGTGIALYSGAVLGTGILALPGIAAQTAGPASLLAWLALSVLSFPLALTFAALARRVPRAGGFAAYIVLAFGPTAGRVAGWLFLAQVPTGAAFVGLLAASYLGAPIGLGREGSFLIAASLIALALAVNLLGLRIAGAAQLAATGGVLVLVAVIVIASVGDIGASAFVPFAPHGGMAVGVAAVQLFWAYVGWEAITPLAEEFRDPERNIPRATVVSVALASIIYLALAVATVGTRAYGSETGLPSFALMAEHAFGRGALLVTGLAAGVLAFTPLTAYLAGLSRLAYALALSRDLPKWLGALHQHTHMPQRALLVLGAGGLGGLAVTYLLGLQLGDVLPFSTSAFLATYVLSMAAGVRLLAGPARLLALVGLVACVAVLVFVGALVVWIAVVSLAAVLYGLARGSPLARAGRARETVKVRPS